MNRDQMIPFYAPDGSSLGSRTIEAVRRLVANGYVKPAYGRKGHIKALFLQQEDGGNPVESHARTGTRYSFSERLDNGQHCWKLRRLDQRDEDGVFVSTRGVFQQVVKDCLVA